VEYPKGPGRLATAGVKFAFQSGGLTNWSEFTTNVQRAVEGGLSADNAIKALTMQPAELFGVSDRMGTLEAGKIANLTVTRGDLTDKGVRVSQLFVDGRPIALHPPAAAGGGGFQGRGGGGGGGTPPSGSFINRETPE
ncbi:MAG: amidohydrolase family protein, partial [bacterium]